MKRQEEDSLQVKKKGLEQIAPSQPSEGTNPTGPLILGFQPPELTQYISVVSGPQSVGLCHGSPSKPIAPPTPIWENLSKLDLGIYDARETFSPWKVIINNINGVIV